MTQFAATYVSGNTFELTGDQRVHFQPNRAVKIDCGGTFVNSHVDVSIYTTVTTVTLLTPVLTDPITMVYNGLDPASLPLHTHEGESQGGSGVVGQPPDHEWSGTQLRFRLPNGTWASYVDLKGATGTPGADGADGTTFTPQGNWTGGVGYVVGDIVVNRGSSYICILNHTSDVTGLMFYNQPGVGSATTTYWMTAGQTPFFPVGAWASGSVQYHKYDGVVYNGSFYQCTANHVSSGSNYPGSVGADWTLYVSKGDTGATGAQGDPGLGIQVDGSLELDEIGSPTDPASGSHKVYFKSDGLLYAKNSSGSEVEVGSGGGGGVPAEWTPPEAFYDAANPTRFNYKTGRYYRGGMRIEGQYYSAYGDILTTYWYVDGGYADIATAYSAGVSSGLIGGRVASSWYAAFLVNSAAGTGEVMFLPMMRVKAVTGTTTLTVEPGDHATGGSNENGLITANDQFNGYFALHLNSLPTINRFPIVDTINGTPDQLLLDNPDTLPMSAGDWLVLMPNHTTDFVYIGSVWLNGSLDITRFTRLSGLKTEWHHVRPSVSVTGATSYADVDVNQGICPLARRAHIAPWIDGGANNGAVKAQFADVDGDAILADLTSGADANHSVLSADTWLMLDQIAKVNTRFMRNTSSTDYAANGTLYLQGWEE